MIGAGDRDYVLFDGDCGICSYCAEWARRRDRKGRFDVHPYQFYSAEALAGVGLTYEKCGKKAWVVSRSGRRYGGALAVNYVLLAFFPWSLLGLIFYLVPPLLLLEIVAYYFVGRNRHVLSRWLGLKACAIKTVPASER
ncbi:MAG TPA: DUF393 domain-containing protein [Blastocatellia bacterium]|nr:DUF393 domain-containing protein [Blastocatellia bacterium]